MNASILTWLTFLPVAGAVVVLLLPGRGRAPQVFSLLLTLFLFVLALHLPAHFKYAAGFQYELNVPWISNPAIRYHVGVDGLSMWLVVLVSFLAPLGVLISWRSIQDRKREFYALLLLQQTAMYGVFISLDLILYYAFWELSIVPLALMIGMYGRTSGSRRAAIKFFLYAFISSALLLVGMIWLYSQTGTFDFVALQHQLHSWNTGAHTTGLWFASLAFLLAFAVKVPVFPLHGWLRDGLSEAPTAVMMILAGKLGLYSLLRWHIGLFPVEAAHIAPLMVALAVIGILYGALMALVQTDLKYLAAYATLSAVSFVVLGIYSFTLSGMAGATYQILNESISASAFFMLLAILYERYGTFDMGRLGGVAAKMPHLATLFVITTLALIGLPSLGNFVGEFLILSGSFQTHASWTAAATVGVILSVAYMLWMVQRVFYGAQSAGVAALTSPDVNWRERAAIWPMIALMIVMGVASIFWMRAINVGVVSSMVSSGTHAHIVSSSEAASTR